MSENGELAVLPTDVVNAADWWPVADRAVRASAVGVDEGVVGHHRLGRLEAELGEETECVLERAGIGLGVLARVQLDVDQAAVVVEDAVEVVVADAAVAVGADAAAGHAMARE